MSLRRFPFYLIASLFVFFHAGFVSAESDAPGSLIDYHPTKVNGYAAACMSGSSIDDKKKSCDKAGKHAQDVCKSDSVNGGKVDGTTHVLASEQQMNANQGGANESGSVAAACCPAAAACQSECSGYESAAGQCSPQDPSDPSSIAKANEKKQAGPPDAKGMLNEACKQAQKRCAQASQQKPENNKSKDDGQRSKDQGKDDGGGKPPQMPQMPQGGGGDKGGGDSSPTETAANDPCKDNPRNCQTSEGTPPATFAAGSGDTTVNSDPLASSTPSSSSSNGYVPASLSGAGSATAAGAYSGGGGGSGSGPGSNAGTKPAEEKAKDKLNSNMFGGDGGGGGGGTATSYSGGDDDKAGKGKVYPHMTAAGMAGRQNIGMTGSGGRTNWEKVGLRYRDNMATFMKDDAQFFKAEPPPAAAAAASAAPKK